MRSQEILHGCCQVVKPFFFFHNKKHKLCSFYIFSRIHISTNLFDLCAFISQGSYFQISLYAINWILGTESVFGLLIIFSLL